DPRPPHRLRRRALRPRGEPPPPALRRAVVDRYLHPHEDAHGRVRGGVPRGGPGRPPRRLREEPPLVWADRDVVERAAGDPAAASARPRRPGTRPASPRGAAP